MPRPPTPSTADKTTAARPPRRACDAEPAGSAFGARLTKVGRLRRRPQGLQFAYHHHLGTVVERPEDLEAFLANTGPSVGPDRRHRPRGSGRHRPRVDDPRRIRSRVAHVHARTSAARCSRKAIRASGGSFLDGVLAGMFTVPGDGDLDYAAVMRGAGRDRLFRLDHRRGRAGPGHRRSARPTASSAWRTPFQGRKPPRRPEGGEVMTNLLVRPHAPDASRRGA